MARGTDILQKAADRYRDERLQQPVVQRCSHCEWTITGILLETGPAFRAHLGEHHPDITIIARRPRRTTRLPKVTEKTLDDNIANARAQGASIWAGPLE